jgi:hypothetical protein
MNFTSSPDSNPMLVHVHALKQVHPGYVPSSAAGAEPKGDDNRGDRSPLGEKFDAINMNTHCKVVASPDPVTCSTPLRLLGLVVEVSGSRRVRKATSCATARSILVFNRERFGVEFRDRVRRILGGLHARKVLVTRYPPFPRCLP